MLLGRVIKGWDLFRFFSNVIFHSELLVFYSLLSLEVKRLWAAELIQKVLLTYSPLAVETISI